MPTRKICLWFNVIFFATIINQETVRLTFVFELLGVFLLGIGVALIVSLSIFPLFATCDIENRVKYCLQNLNQMEIFILEAFLSEDPAAARVSLARASIVERRVRQTMDHMHTRILEARYEPCQILQRNFKRQHQDVMNLTLEGYSMFFSIFPLWFCFDLRARRSDDVIDVSCMFITSYGRKMSI